MEWTDREKEIAKTIVNDPDTCALLQKAFLTATEKLSPAFLEGKDNSELGEIVRADIHAEQKILTRWQALVNLAQSTESLDKKIVAPE